MTRRGLVLCASLVVVGVLGGAGCQDRSLAPVRDLRAEVVGDGIRLRFTASDDDGRGMDIVRGYQVLRGHTADGPFAPFGHTPIETLVAGSGEEARPTRRRSLVDTSAVLGVAYHYQVWALAENERSSPSHAGARASAAVVGPARRPGRAAAPPSPAPVAAVRLAAPDQDDGRHVDVAFELSPDDDAGRRVALDGYVVLRAEDPDGPYRPFVGGAVAEAGEVPPIADPAASEARVRALTALLGDRAVIDPADRATLARLSKAGAVRRAPPPRVVQDRATQRLQALVLEEIAGSNPPDRGAGRRRVVRDTVPGDGPFHYRVYAVPTTGEAVGRGPRRGVQPRTTWFATNKANLAAILGAALVLTLVFLRRAERDGESMYIRRIPGIDALEEAVGRATEMGRPILYVPGIDEIQNIQTIASLLILGRVAELVARYDSQIRVPCCIPIVATVAEEVVRQGFYNAARPDQHRPQNIQWISSEQFAFCAGTNGIMLRDKPATNIFLGRFFAESLILAETGYVNRAIQIAGTAEITQLPFFIAACDYTLLGEELFAVSAYMSRDPRLLSTLKAADWIKAVTIFVLVAGVIVAFAAPSSPAMEIVNAVLRTASGGGD